MNLILPSNISMWQHCLLEGDALDTAVARCHGWIDYPDDVYAQKYWYTPGDKYVVVVGKVAFTPSTNWTYGGPIIEANQIFLNPPHDTHVHGGTNAGWHRSTEWSAVVSKRVRSYKNEHGYDCVGRGVGPTPLIAAMRAYVASFGVKS